jgi:glycosyltransferase involved in cell wall biosynthesis
MTVPLVSILIPCYNAKRWIAETLNCALEQSWPNKEIIVVDDESSDGSREIVQAFIPRGIKLIIQSHSGASTARNRALSEAKGEYIQFLDADDLLAPDKIETQMSRLAANPSLSIASGAWGRFFDLRQNTRFFRESVWIDLSPVDWLVTSWCGGGMMATHAWLTPRTVIERAGKWDETLSVVDDGEFFTRVVLNSKQVLFCDDARSYYRSGVAGSLSTLRSSANLSSTYRSVELSTNHLLKIENSPRTRRACAALFQRFVYDTYPSRPDLISKAESRVRDHGGSDYQLNGGGPGFRVIARSLGWKQARRLQLLKQRLGRQ